MSERKLVPQKPTGAFIGVSWFVLLLGVGGFLVALYNSSMELRDKGSYFTILMFGLFAVISIQKTIRDKAEDIPVTGIYYGLAWFFVLLPLVMLLVNLWNADMLFIEKAFYGVTMVFSLFSVITVQKNVRDLAVFAEVEKNDESKRKPVASGQEMAKPVINPTARPYRPEA
jgi:uncharacterized membrane protein YiaA